MKPSVLLLGIFVPFSVGATDFGQTDILSAQPIRASTDHAVALGSYRIPALAWPPGFLPAFNLGLSLSAAPRSELLTATPPSTFNLRIDMPLGLDSRTNSSVLPLDQAGSSPHGAASAGAGVFTPYAGLGKVSLKSAFVNPYAPEAEESLRHDYYVGARFDLTTVNIAVETDRTEDAPTYALTLSWRF